MADKFQRQRILQQQGDKTRLKDAAAAGQLAVPAGDVEATETFSNNKYFPVETPSPFRLLLPDLIAGSNIVGVRTAGPMTVQLPLGASEEQVIIVSDERGTADVDPITVEIV